MGFLAPLPPRDAVLFTVLSLTVVAAACWGGFVHENGPRSELEAKVIECSRRGSLWTMNLDREPYAVTLEADRGLAVAMPTVCPSGTRVHLVVRAKPRAVEPLYWVDALENRDRGQVLLTEASSWERLHRELLFHMAVMALFGAMALQLTVRGVRGALQERRRQQEEQEP